MKFSKSSALALTLAVWGCADKTKAPLPDMNNSSLVDGYIRQLPLGGEPNLRALFGRYADRKCLEASGVIPRMTLVPPPATVGEAIEEQRSLALPGPRRFEDADRTAKRATEVFEQRDVLGPWRMPKEGQRECRGPLTFYPDGRWDAGGAEGDWSLRGNVLTLRTVTDQISWTLGKADGMNLDIVNAQGRPLKLRVYTNTP